MQRDGATRTPPPGCAGDDRHICGGMSTADIVSKGAVLNLLTVL